MPDICCEKQSDIWTIRLMSGEANALTLPTIEELNAAMEQAARDEAIHGLVLAGEVSRPFCSGFDKAEMFHYDREMMTLLIARFIDLYESLYLLPKPTVAAVTGDAFGAGAVLAIACDVRVFASGSFGVALNEIDMGVVLPQGLIRMLAGIVGPGAAREMLLTGRSITPARAIELGLASELVEPDRVLERSLARCAELARKPSTRFAALKKSLREITGHVSNRGDRAMLAEFVEYWFSEEAQEFRRGLQATEPGRTS
jgi:enoyl-CoA hydratase/carnithine racemase